jgi:hypothetical protein
VPVAVQAGYNSGLNRFAAVFARSNRTETRRLTVNGTAVPALAAIDDRITRYLRDTGTRAASVAITRQDRLVYSRAFTWAEPAYPVTTPASTFRIASLSKPITALATMRLVEQGLLGLDDRRIPGLGLIEPRGRPVSEATRRITVRQLLAHTSGLRGIPIVHEVAAAFGVPLPVSERQVAAFGLADVAFEPGMNKQYSNLGYLLRPHPGRFRPHATPRPQCGQCCRDDHHRAGRSVAHRDAVVARVELRPAAELRRIPLVGAFGRAGSDAARAGGVARGRSVVGGRHRVLVKAATLGLPAGRIRGAGDACAVRGRRAAGRRWR